MLPLQGGSSKPSLATPPALGARGAIDAGDQLVVIAHDDIHPGSRRDRSSDENSLALVVS